MKTKTIERIVSFSSEVQQINKIDSNDELYYFDENLGKRAKGSIMINGEVETLQGKQLLQDEIFLDIFAPKAKLDGSHFEIKVNDIKSKINQKDVLIDVELLIEGISDEEVSTKHSFDRLEQMFDQEKMINLATLHVVCEDDTYASIAYKYQV